MLKVIPHLATTFNIKENEDDYSTDGIHISDEVSCLLRMDQVIRSPLSVQLNWFSPAHIVRLPKQDSVFIYFDAKANLCEKDDRIICSLNKKLLILNTKRELATFLELLHPL